MDKRRYADSHAAQYAALLRPTGYGLNKIKILRRVNGELKSIPFKYSRVEKGEDLEQNIVLQGGDVVVVP